MLVQLSRSELATLAGALAPSKLHRMKATYPTRPKARDNLLCLQLRCNTRLEVDFARDHAILLFQHVAALDHGDKLLCEADFALQARPNLGPRDYRRGTGGVDGRSVGEVDVDHFGWSWMRNVCKVGGCGCA